MSEAVLPGAGVLVAAYTDEETAKKVLDNAGRVALDELSRVWTSSG